jgi:SAM-dependent methyltransferase
MAETPKRVLWAVKQLDVAPGDAILEIGSGDGSALSLIVPRIGSGRVVGVDRSEHAIRAARKRNQAALKAGKLSLVQSELAELKLPRQFSKIFAINVNVFWHRPKKELAALRELLRPDGELSLMFEPPSTDQLGHIAELTRRNLEANGFEITGEIRADLAASAAVMVRAALLQT